MKLLFFHGWGFDRTVWDSVIARLPDFAGHADDRGYFGSPEGHRLDEDYLAVTHSYGTMRALSAPLNCRGLIAINGFDRFSESSDFPGISQRVLKRMLSRFATDPAGVLTDFRSRLGAEEAPEPCAEPLLADLKGLAEKDFRGAFHGPVLSLQSADDPLLAPPMREAVFASVRVERHEVISGGHLLPLTRPELCAAEILRFSELVR